ncbi:hypothetical protein N7474_007260 [Penicillium riverlandense]|uniref:uncharacterized protein n=1 Tax=Penicillium riverlandense TaxID=1903569 RepID=UPI002547F303|nr:uncharacterized protein N7474_007260 [Penicillium riverlandense]KAJ5815483.1 hypothetical protein N7474_007260 [Penicillium riverlandense]
MPLTIPAPSATIARAIVERLPGFAYAQGANVTFRDSPHRGEPGIYEALNGELALATQGTTPTQRSFLADIFQGEFRRHGGQDALYFTTQCPVLHSPSYLTSSSALEHMAASEPSIVTHGSVAPGTMPALTDLPRLSRLAKIVPLLSQGHSFATVEPSILPALSGWCTPYFDWIDWNTSDEANTLRDTDLLNQATPAQLAKLLTVIIRQERFVDGTIETAYESKLLARIAQRAATILQPS